MRIIAGKWKAKKLMSPKTDKTRPTLDRVKESVFNISLFIFINKSESYYNEQLPKF